MSRTDSIRIHGCPDAEDYSALVKAESRRLILDLYVESESKVETRAELETNVGFIGSKMITKSKVITVVNSKAITRCECGDA